MSWRGSGEARLELRRRKGREVAVAVKAWQTSSTSEGERSRRYQKGMMGLLREESEKTTLLRQKLISKEISKNELELEQMLLSDCSEMSWMNRWKTMKMKWEVN